MALTKEKPKEGVSASLWGIVEQMRMDKPACESKNGPVTEQMSECRVWVGRVAALVGDRNAEVRRAACQALHLVYTGMDGPTLLTHVAHASPPDQVITSSLRAHLQPHSLSVSPVPARFACTHSLCFLCPFLHCHVFSRVSCLLWQWNCTKAQSVLPTAMAQVIAGAFCLQHAKRSVTLS